MWCCLLYTSFQEVYGTDYLFQSESVEYKKPENIDYEKEYQKLVERTDDIEKELENIKTVPHLTSREDRKKLISKKKEIEFTEEETRLIIDKQLTEAGWEVDTKVLNYKLNKTLPEKKRNIAIAEDVYKRQDLYLLNLLQKNLLKI